MCNKTDIFQERMYGIFEGFDTVHIYLDLVIVIIKYKCLDYLKASGKVLHKLAELGLKVKYEREFFGGT